MTDVVVVDGGAGPATNAGPWHAAPTYPTVTDEQRRCRDVMIDLETMGHGPAAAILSIGLVRFDIETGRVGAEWHWQVDLQSSIDAGGVVDASTVMWWLDPLRRPAVDAMIADRRANGAIPIRKALELVVDAFDEWGAAQWRDWLNQEWLPVPGSHTPVDRVWARGPQFDLVILRSAFAACGLEAPWRYWQERDVRTLLEAVERLNGRRIDLEPRGAGGSPRVEHDALSDAKDQAGDVVTAWRLIREAQIGMDALAQVPMPLEAGEVEP